MNMRVNILYAITLLAGSLACTKTAEVIQPNALPAPQLYFPGADEVFQVPGTNTVGSYFLDTETNKIYIKLGVGQSGLSKKGGFEVSLLLDTDTVSKLIQSLGDAYMQFPDEMVTMPDRLEAQSGEDGAPFRIELDMETASDYVGKTLVLAIKLANPTNYGLSATEATKLIYLNYLNLLGLPTFVDEFDARDYTGTYADMTGVASFEMVGDPQNYYNDAHRILRSSDEAVTLTYDVTKINTLLPFAESFSGFKINALAPNIDIFKLLKVTYSHDDGQTFTDAMDIKVDAVNIPELGLNSWIDFHLQAPLTTGTTHLRVELLNQVGTGLPPWNPLLRRIEIFYDGGTPYRYQQP